MMVFTILSCIFRDAEETLWRCSGRTSKACTGCQTRPCTTWSDRVGLCFGQIVLSQIQSLLPLMAAVAGLWSPSSQLRRLRTEFCYLSTFDSDIQQDRRSSIIACYFNAMRLSVAPFWFQVFSRSRASSTTVVCLCMRSTSEERGPGFAVFQQRLRGALNLCTKQLCYYSFNAVCKNSLSSLFLSSS